MTLIKIQQGDIFIQLPDDIEEDEIRFVKELVDFIIGFIERKKEASP